ncbi:hypothetical protein HG536_0B04570 [Torulaspora globosa]|uniref:Uncharacterized protein n=1 Tax=Torulaspora globosa TaxID=48254 RepID=A0A7G3ZDK7_9SACH|nr:uncharacterized protein HG536_0B04570 [Torulaspora globosa]QLL31593.1 hypothetical protein HG536_0B04570 [Torulaspora globosa]
MSQRAGPYAGMNNAHAYQQPQQRERDAGFTSKQMLDAYIYDFLLKSSLKNSASTFCREAGILDATGEPKTPSVLDQVKDAPQGFLYEWWQIFWDLFNARTHKEGSVIAREFSRILANKQKEEHAYRSQAVQAAMLQQMAEQQGECPRGAFEFFQASGVIPNPDYVNHAFHPSASSYTRNEPSNMANQAHVSSHIPHFVPSNVGTNIPGWPVYPNQIPSHFVNSTTGNHIPSHAAPTTHVNQYQTSGPAPSPGSQSVGSKTKQSRPSSTKKKKHALNLAGTPGSPENSTASYKGSMTGLSGKISGIEGLHNYQRQLIMSEIEYNNQNKKNSPSSSTGVGGGSKKHMLPPSAAFSPHTVSPASAGIPNMNMISSSKRKITRRTSASQISGPANKSTRSSLSDSPCTPVTLGPVSGGDLSDKQIAPNPPTELSKQSSAGSHESSGKKSVKKVRKTKKPQSITFNKNNFNFLSSNSVPTPPNESQQRPQHRTSSKSNKKPSSVRPNTKTFKSAAEASPQLLVDDGSMATPTFIKSVWNSNGKAQNTPHANLTFVEDNPAHTGGAGFANVDSVAGSSSGASYQYSETEADDILSMNAILPMHESAAAKDEVPSTDVVAAEQTAYENSNPEFNLDLLEPSEHSFNFLSWRQ